jgi:hypothetical protein
MLTGPLWLRLGEGVSCGHRNEPSDSIITGQISCLAEGLSAFQELSPMELDTSNCYAIYRVELWMTIS